jgi:hypothetical protein
VEEAEHLLTNAWIVSLRFTSGQEALRKAERLDRAIEASAFDAENRRMALEDDRQGIVLSRPKADMN